MQHLSEGEMILVQGSGKKPYEVKNSGGVISCSCPAWRNQSLQIDMRTCKHIKANVSNGAAPSVQSGSVVNAMATTPSVPAKVATPKNVPPCLLAHSWDGAQDMSGWIASEKLDGVRAWWDGKTFWSRLGNEYHAPQWFKDQMPKDVVLDGELFAGNGKFQETVGCVKKLNPIDAEWKTIKFMIFDAPTNPGTYQERLVYLQDHVVPSANDEPYHQLVGTKRMVDNNHVRAYLKLMETSGYEGIMLREPSSLYVDGRSTTLLKVKTFFDCEVTVSGYQNGKGKHKGRMGSLDCKMDSGVEFNVGSGFTDKERVAPPAIGTRVTVRYQELTRDGVPRFPTFVSARDYE